MTEPIKVKGLKQFGRDLKKWDADLPKMVRIALNNSAERVIASAKPKVPRRSGGAANTMKPKSTRTKARVSAGNTRNPHYPWLDFGGSVGRRSSVKRPFLKKGRYIYPAYFRLRDSGEFAEVMSDELVKVGERAGIDVTDG